MYKLVCISYILLSFHAGISESCLQHIEWAEVLPSSAADDCHSRDQSPRVPLRQGDCDPQHHAQLLWGGGETSEERRKDDSTTSRYCQAYTDNCYQWIKYVVYTLVCPQYFDNLSNRSCSVDFQVKIVKVIRYW